jgi:hypothetical protein
MADDKPPKTPPAPAPPTRPTPTVIQTRSEPDTLIHTTEARPRTTEPLTTRREETERR